LASHANVNALQQFIPPPRIAEIATQSKIATRTFHNTRPPRLLKPKLLLTFIDELNGVSWMLSVSLG